MIWLAALSLAIWLYLPALHGHFWSAGPVLRDLVPPVAPPVTIVVPARDEAPTIEAALKSLLGQLYAGALRIVLVDDCSTDGTGAIARAIEDPRLAVISGAPRPPGWSGKLWAVHQGVAAADTPLIFLCDADIVHAREHLTSLVTQLESEDLDLVSEMVALNCASPAERWLVPAFVYFFQLLYPFAQVNNPNSRKAAAAGGTMLVRASALSRIGGIEALRGALIDDVTLATRIKRTGGKIWLGHSLRAFSRRPYPGAADIWRMVARTAFVQLRFSWLLLIGTTLGLALVFLVPPALALFASGPAHWLGSAAWLAAALSYIPTLRRFRLRAWYAPFLPLIAAFYMAATIGSALDHVRGRGVRWKDRSYTDRAAEETIT